MIYDCNEPADILLTFSLSFNSPETLVNVDNTTLFLNKLTYASFSDTTIYIPSSICFTGDPDFCAHYPTFFEVDIQPFIDYGKSSPLLEFYLKVIVSLLKLWVYVSQNKSIPLLNLMMRRYLYLKHDFAMHLSRVHQQYAVLDIIYCYWVYLMVIYHKLTINIIMACMRKLSKLLKSTLVQLCLITLIYALVIIVKLDQNSPAT